METSSCILAADRSGHFKFLGRFFRNGQAVIYRGATPGHHGTDGGRKAFIVCKFQPVECNVCDGDIFASYGLCCCGAKKANGSGADDKASGAFRDVRSLHGVNCNGQRFQQSSFVV
jgi:hypothetical protein